MNRNTEKAIYRFPWKPEQVTRNFDMFYQMWRRKVSASRFWSLFQSPVLDAGCGRGVFVKELIDHGFDAYGLDLSFFEPGNKGVAIKSNPGLPKDHLKAGHGDNIPFPDEYFGTIFESDGPLTYCDSPELFDRTLKSYLRALKIGGRIIVTSCRICAPGHSNRFLVCNNWVLLQSGSTRIEEILEAHSLKALAYKRESGEILTETIHTNTRYNREADYHWDYGIGIITKLK